MGLEQHRAAAAERRGPLRFAIVTVSDTRDATTDRGGAYLAEAVAAAGHAVAARTIVRDEPAAIEAAVLAAARDAGVDLVLVTGGTGIAPRDVTVPTVAPHFTAHLPGFGELFRQLSYEQVGSAAILSRACGGLIGSTVCLLLPGSVKALELAWERIVAPEAGHLVAQARG